ncbi:nucleotidyltransferase domain-containing protein [Streptomyces sp. NPDC006879]|uniref:nucleotidyltransferase domain-containing protein n=1 Tax=Streptomyces sp. NPDC006879 TaxID=3364767 RepID=UPI0036C6C019
MRSKQAPGNHGRRGLDSLGYIEREGSLGLVQEAFHPVVSASRERLAQAFAHDLHSAYLYGSVPRGTARPGVSDLDLLLALHHPPTEAARALAREVGDGLDADYAVIDGVSVLVHGKAELLSEAERYDTGWFLACLCTALLGPDLAEHLPRYRPDERLARESNGDLPLLLPRWRAQVAAASGPAERRSLSRLFARKLVRSAFTLVMPRWGGWTSDLTRSTEIFADFYPHEPARVAELRRAAAVARNPSPDPAVLTEFTEDLGPWLAAEYTAVLGGRAPRP